ncbi:MAG: hypothetical protein MUD09_06975 [Desulfobacterales bacterium]|nr:hypothetical protein [Desulfobacterales bacterium]
MDDNKCPVCSSDEIRIDNTGDGGQQLFIECPICGDFMMTRLVTRLYNKELNNPRLSAWIRDYKERDADPPEIKKENVKIILDNLPNYTPIQKQFLLLRYIEKKTEYPGKEILLSPKHDYPVAWSSCADEFGFYLSAIKDRGFIASAELDETFTSDFPLKLSITADGWEYLENHAQKSAFMDQAFIAMSFSSELQTAYDEGIKKGVEDAGYKAYRIDKEDHIERIDAKIISEIQNSRFLVADVTGQKQGVYFEAGYAFGLKIPVIWTVRKDEIEKVHFDTRQYRHILWDTPDDLRENLCNLICAVIGRNKKSK